MGKLTTRRVTMRERGFTLIELMIAVVIVAILLSVAVPAYQDSIRKGRRTDARNALMAAQLVQEKYRGNNATYGTTAQTGLATTSEKAATTPLRWSTPLPPVTPSPPRQWPANLRKATAAALLLLVNQGPIRRVVMRGVIAGSRDTYLELTPAPTFT